MLRITMAAALLVVSGCGGEVKKAEVQRKWQVSTSRFAYDGMLIYGVGGDAAEDDLDKEVMTIRCYIRGLVQIEAKFDQFGVPDMVGQDFTQQEMKQVFKSDIIRVGGKTIAFANAGIRMGYYMGAFGIDPKELAMLAADPNSEIEISRPGSNFVMASSTVGDLAKLLPGLTANCKS